MPSEDSLAEPVSTAHFTGQQGPSHFTPCGHSSARSSVASWCLVLAVGDASLGSCIGIILRVLRGTCAKLRESCLGWVSSVGQAFWARKTWMAYSWEREQRARASYFCVSSPLQPVAP